MAKIAYKWEDLWAIYDNLTPEAQKDSLIALAETLKSTSPSAQAKALEAAPMPIIKAHAHLLHDKAKKTLGLEEEKKSKMTKKEWSQFEWR